MWWNDYIGKEFKEKGRGPDYFDCWGLVRHVYLYHFSGGPVLPSYDECYKSTQDKDILASLIKEQSQQWKYVHEPKEFDIVVLKIVGLPFHVGIVTKQGYMLHCLENVNTVHEKYTSMRWANKIAGFYRHEPINNTFKSPAIQS